MILPAIETPSVKAEGDPPITPVDTAPTPRRTVLVVDDEVELADSLADVLSRLGFQTCVVYGGRAAQTMLTERSFDLVVTDLRMPDLDGAALYGWAVERRLPILHGFAFMTGDILSPAAKALRQHPDTRFLEKPFNLSSVEAFVRELT